MPQQEQKKFELTPAQAEVARDPHRFRVLNMGRRTGKTTLAIDQIKGRASIPNSRIAYVANTYQQARDIAWEQLKSECVNAAENINEARLEIRLVNGSFIILRGWEAIETLRGQRFDLIVLDEVAQMVGFWERWHEVVRPTLTDTKGEALFCSTPRGYNHFFELYHMDPATPSVSGILKDKDYKSFHFTTYDNPHMPKEEIDKAKEELTADRFEQEYLANFKRTEGLVYKEFDRSKHLINIQDVPQDITKILGGVDFGYTAPAAVMTIAKDRQNRYFVIDEWYKTGQTDAQIADWVASLNWHECYPDPESAGGVEELRRRKVNVREVHKGKESVRNGISVVRELFKANRLFIASHCKNLIWEIETLSYPDKKPFHNEEEVPIKENDHACDALRYALAMESNNNRISFQIYKPKFVGFNRRA